MTWTLIKTISDALNDLNGFKDLTLFLPKEPYLKSYDVI